MSRFADLVDARLSSVEGFDGEDLSGALGEDLRQVSQFATAPSENPEIFATVYNPSGGETIANQITAGTQYAPRITYLTDGKYVVSWTTTADASPNDIHARIFNANGTAFGSEFVVNGNTAGNQSEVDISALSGGGFVVVWIDATITNGDVRARLYDATGTALTGDIQINDPTQPQAAAGQTQLAVVGLAGGRFAVTWADNGTPEAGSGASGSQVRSRVFESTGTPVAGSETQVNTTAASFQHYPAISKLGAGYIVVFQDNSGAAGAGDDIRAQRYDVNGAKIGGEILITSTAGSQQMPAVVELNNGTFAVSWNDLSGVGGDAVGVRARIFSAAGVGIGSEFLVNVTTAGGQYDVALARLADGGFVATWTDLSQSGGDTSGAATRSRTFDANGIATNAERLVNTTTSSDQYAPAVAADASGNYTIAFQDLSTDGGNIRFQRFVATVLNDAPSGTNATLAIDEDTPRALAAVDFGFSDVNGHAFAGVVLTTLPANGTLALNGTAVTVAGTFVTAAQIMANQLVFTPATNANGTGYASFTFQVRDDGGTSGGGVDTDQSANTLTFNVIAVNDAPVLGGGGNAVGYTENAGGVVVNTALTVSDVDSTTLTGATVTIGTGRNVGDTLGFTNQNGITGSYDASTGVLTLAGSTTLANYQTALRSVTFSSTSDDPTSAARTISFVVDDGTGANNLSAAATSTVNVTALNDKPTLSGFGPSVTFTESAVNGAPQLLDIDVTIANAEANFAGETLTLSGGLAEDTIAIRNQGIAAGQIGVSGGNVTYGGAIIGTVSGGNGTTALSVVLNANATSAAVDALIENLTYANASDTPTASRTLSLNITDAGGFAGIGTFSQLTGATNPFNGIDVGNLSAPAFVDFDGDGDLDLVVGEQNTLQVYRNNGVGQPLTQLTGSANPFNGIAFGADVSPAFVDLDGDGDLDGVFGNYAGQLIALRNNGAGTAFTLISGAANPFNGINFGTNASAAFIDFDGDGDLDTVTSSTSSALRAFRNNGNGVAVTELTGAANPFAGLTVGSNGKIAALDFDFDGDSDLVLAAGVAGPLQAYRNNGAGQSFTALTGAANPFNGISGAGNGTIGFSDFDRDGDTDFVLGMSNGTLSAFRNDTIAARSITVNVTAVNDAPVFAAGALLTRVSTTSTGGNSDAAITFEAGDVSADGTKVLFASSATNLVAGDTNGVGDVFLKDLTTGAVTRVSTGAGGVEGTGGSSRDALLSPDGSKVVFTSNATNLVAGDSNGVADVFVKTLATGAIERVSVSASGFTLNAGGSNGIFSPDGTKVAFQANNQIYVKTLATGVLELVSKDGAGVQGNGTSSSVVFSPDGTKIAFASTATNLVAGDTNGSNDVFVKDLVTGAVTLVSVAPDGSQAGASSFEPAFSPDGTKIVFRSLANNLSAADGDGTFDIFVRDLVANTTTLVSADANGIGANQGSQNLTVRPFSPDGSTVYFATGATNLTSGAFGAIDIYGKNLITGAVTLISVRETGARQSSNAFDAVVAANGAVLFRTDDRLVASDTDNFYDQFLTNPDNLPPTYRENAAAVAVVGAVSVSDADSANYAGGTFSAAITTNSATGDQLTLASSGGASGINVVGSSVRYNGVEIGILTAAATTLSVALDSDATDAAVKALAEAVRFASTSESPGSATRTVTFTLNDGGGTANGGASTTSFTRTVAVVGVNDAPAGADATITINEDSPRTLTAADFGFTDVDGGTLSAVVISSLPTAGTLTLSGAAVVVGQVITTANIPNLRFAPAANANGVGYASFTFQVRDNGGTANGGVDTDQSPNTLTFNVTAVNDAPAGADSSHIVLDNAVLTFAASDFSTGFSDIDGNAFAGVRIASLPGSGTLKLNGTAIAAGTSVTLAQLDAGNLTFEPAAGSGGTTPLFTFQVRDDGGTANGGVDLDQSANIFTIDIRAANAAPVLDLNGADAGTGVAVTVDENIGGIVAPNAILTDADSPNFDGGTLTVSYGANGTASDFISVQDQSGQFAMNNRIGVGFNAGNFVFYYNTVLVGTAPAPMPGSPLVVTFNANATPAAAQALARAVTTFNLSDAPPAGARDLTFTLTDGDGGTASAIASVTTTPVNDAPVIDLNTNTAGINDTNLFVEGSFDPAIGSAISVSDPDGDTIKGAVVTITDAIAGDSITYNLPLPAGITIDPSSTASRVVLTGTASAAAYAQALGQFGYHNSSDNPTVGGTDTTRTITVTVNDGTVDSAAATSTITIVGVNDAPVLGGGGNAIGYTEQAAGAVVNSAITVADADSANLTGATVTIGGRVAGDVLAFANQNGITGTFDAATGVLTLSGSASVANYQAALRTIVFSSTSDNPTAYGASPTRTISFVVDDGQSTNHASAAITTTINVTAVNDAPVSTGFDNVTFTEGQAFVQLDTGFDQLLTDPDSLNFDGGTLTFGVGANKVATEDRLTFLTGGSSFLAVSGNTISYQGVTFATFSPSGVGLDRSFTFNANATVEAVRTLMRNLAYIDTNQDNPSTAQRTIDYVLTDGDGATLTLHSTVDIVAVNDAPTGTDATINVRHGVRYQLSAADFGFVDVDGNSLASVTITTLPTAGRLIYYAPGLETKTIVTAGTVLTADQLANGRLIYNPTPGVNDAASGSFTFQVSDNGGTANGGVDKDPTANTLTFTVPPNIAPEGHDASLAIMPGVKHVITAQDFGFTDVDGYAFDGVTITTIGSGGRLLYNAPGTDFNVAVTNGQMISAADIAAGRLIYKLPAASNATGGSFTFQVRDNGGTGNGGVDTDQSPNTITFYASTGSPGAAAIVTPTELFAHDHASASPGDDVTADMTRLRLDVYGVDGHLAAAGLTHVVDGVGLDLGSIVDTMAVGNGATFTPFGHGVEPEDAQINLPGSHLSWHHAMADQIF